MKINNALNQLKRIKNSRSPGIDGMIIEHLSRVFLGGDKDEKCKSETSKDCAECSSTHFSVVNPLWLHGER